MLKAILRSKYLKLVLAALLIFTVALCVVMPQVQEKMRERGEESGLSLDDGEAGEDFSEFELNDAGDVLITSYGDPDKFRYRSRIEDAEGRVLMEKEGEMWPLDGDFVIVENDGEVVNYRTGDIVKVLPEGWNNGDSWAEPESGLKTVYDFCIISSSSYSCYVAADENFEYLAGGAVFLNVFNVAGNYIFGEKIEGMTVEEDGATIADCIYNNRPLKVKTAAFVMDRSGNVLYEQRGMKILSIDQYGNLEVQRKSDGRKEVVSLTARG